MLHHLTLWVPDLARATPSWRWLMVDRLGYSVEQRSERMLLFRDTTFTLVLEQSSDMVPGMLHSRLRPGLNHVAFTVGSTGDLAEVVAAAPDHGWSPLPVDRHPIAASADVTYLEDRDGFEVELVATSR